MNTETLTPGQASVLLEGLDPESQRRRVRAWRTAKALPPEVLNRIEAGIAKADANPPNWRETISVDLAARTLQSRCRGCGE